MPDSSRKIRIVRVSASERARLDDDVATEEPLEIRLASASPAGAAAKSISITMRTPGDDPNLAAGFLFTEGIIAAPTDIVDVAHRGPPDPVSGVQNVVCVELDPGVDIDLERLTRHFYTTSSCGVCGKASLDALRVSGLKPVADDSFHIKPTTLYGLPAALRRRQAVFRETGGLHAAAIFGPDGEIGIVREDVGRHNATDKLIGALFRTGELPAHRHGILVSGRASFELMQKALTAGFPLLAAVGAPSSLAVELAREFGMSLVGFLRDGTFNVYAGENRID